MQKRICPICDHPMQKAHYCSFCKQWIKHPHYVNATYYLNERHPADETNCEYHNESAGSFEKAAKTGADTVRALAERAKTYSQTKTTGAGSQPGRQAAVQTPNRENTARPMPQKNTARPAPQRNITTLPGENKNKKGNSNAGIILTIIIIMFAMWGINYLYRIFMYLYWLL